ncbi:hypothetical protein KFK09_011624 [Dendrobium nobile]|uniref:Uncharacterized protein n=1 Tax=Dendrobium nobile TaxID=94219 RepID=A0A8T3BDE2_DENNO|nr:hypothetical protein KFK09_011624 [Dendrobium nobile]
MTHRLQQPPYPQMLCKHHHLRLYLSHRPTAQFKHLIKLLKPQNLKLARHSKENADEQENPGAINPGSQCGGQCRSLPRLRGSRRGEEECFVGKLDGEGGEENSCEVTEGPVDFAGVGAADGGGVMAEAVEEEVLEGGGEGEEGDDGEDGFRELGEEGGGGRVEKVGVGDGDYDVEGEESEVGDSAGEGGGVVEGAVFEAGVEAEEELFVGVGGGGGE